MGIVLIFTFGMICFNCDTDNTGDTGNTSTGTKKLIGLNISNANSLFITSSPIPSLSVRAVDQSENNKMFKITEEGYVQEITYSYEDENGNQLTSTEVFTPTAIHNINENFIMVIFSQEAYLIRKTDGAVFMTYDIPIYKPQEGNYKNALAFQIDGSGNIYYQSGNYSSGSSQVVKINITNPNNITRMDYLPNPDTANMFYITQEGHIIYGIGSHQRRIRKANGGLYNLPATQEGFFIGLDGKIKNLTSGLITTYDIDSNYDVTETTICVDGTPWDESYSDMVFSLYSISSNQSYLLRFSNKLMIAGTGGGLVYEIEGENPREIILSQIIIEKVYQSSTFYYIVGKNWSGQPALLKVSPYTDEVINLLPVNTYSIYEMVVSKDDEITFNALRMSDGNKLLGNISALGNVTFLDEISNYQVTSLERIN
jgi:hypothetical protein